MFTSSPASIFWRVLEFAAILLGLAGFSAAQSLNPPYLTGMPSVQKVQQAIQGSDATDTLARQVAAFDILPQVIQRFQVADRSRNRPTPDEQKITNQYTLAAYQLEQSYDKAHSPVEAKAFSHLHYHYELDMAFIQDTYRKLFSPVFMAEFAKVDRSVNTWYKAHLDQEAHAGQAAQQSAATAGMRNDAGSVAERRCLESGRSQTDCVGEGLKQGLNELTGGMLGQVNALSAGPPGLRLSGDFSAAGVSISFDDEFAIVNCGTLIPQQFAYKVELGSQPFVRLPLSPKPIVVRLQPGGKLSGPGPIMVAGSVVVGTNGGGAQQYGMQAHTTTQQQQVSAADVPNYAAGEVHQNGMESTVTTRSTTYTMEPTGSRPRASVVTAPKTERCNVTTLGGSSTIKASTAMANLLGAPAGKSDAPAPVGLRMYGTYAGQGGLSVAFRSDIATVECGEAHVAESYFVEDTGGRVSIHIQNPAQPISLILQPNGLLAGSGTVDVAGRVMTGRRGDEILYSPRNARCTVGTLAPQAAN